MIISRPLILRRKAAEQLRRLFAIEGVDQIVALVEYYPIVRIVRPGGEAGGDPLMLSAYSFDFELRRFIQEKLYSLEGHQTIQILDGDMSYTCHVHEKGRANWEDEIDEDELDDEKNGWDDLKSKAG